MGDYLSTPNKNKHSREGQNPLLQYGCSSMQGWRRTNEDAHITALDFDEGMHLFAVFDGHGGAEVARFCEKHFISELKQDKDYQSKNYEAALKNVFLKLDKMVTTVEGKKELRQLVNPPKTSVIGVNQAGCTANVVLVTPSFIYCANAGDARSVACINGKAVELSKDHKPTLPQERQRILQAGHFVQEERVDGALAISRALGDWEYKNAKLPPEKMAVSGVPDISRTPISGELQFIICACDGIWDCMTSQQAVDFVKKGKSKLIEPRSQSPPKALGVKKQNSSGSKPAGMGRTVGKSPMKRKQTLQAVREQRMETAICQSKFSGLATVVEMMMEVNCPQTLHMSDGIGTDNMTCVLVEFKSAMPKPVEPISQAMP